MKTINVSDEMYDFLMETSRELNTQDNRHTAKPIFRIYEQTKVERARNCGDHVERHTYEGAEEHYCKTCKDTLEETDYDYDALPELGEDGCSCEYEEGATLTYDKRLLPTESNYSGVAFLTEKAAEEYRESNNYHFTGGGVIYAESAFRNWELGSIIDFLQQLNPPEYTTKDTFKIKSRGTVHVVEHKFETDPRNLVDKIVKLDGQNVTVRGVETFAIPFRKSDKVDNIGILIREGLEK